jgi:preprotein translocase subunit Sss1
LGYLWRQICKQRKDPRRDELINLLNVTLTGLDTISAEIVRKWLQESYNKADEIKEIIGEKKKYPAYIVNSDRKITYDEILEITRSCSSTSLSTVMNVINHISISEGNLNDSTNYLPVELNNRELFKYLPHLISPGMEFSLRASVILASLVVLSKNAVLIDRAKEFLSNVKGKWFDVDIPENYAYAFARLFHKPELREYLTLDEYTAIHLTFVIGGFKTNLDTMLQMRQGYTPTKLSKHFDEKIKCNKCNEMRSITLMEGNTCGLCLAGIGDCKEKYDNYHSNFVQCKLCVGLYSVVSVDSLFGIPKCHYCRDLDETNYMKHPRPIIECKNCYNNFIIPNIDSKDKDNYVCAGCQEDPRKTIEEYEASFGTIFNNNSATILKYLGIEIEGNNIEYLTSRAHSLFALKDKIKLVSTTDIDATKFPMMLNNRKPILDTVILLNSIKEWVLSGDSEIVMCYLCCTEKKRQYISKACGHCNSDACNDCLTKWYKLTTVGNVVHKAHLSCPFCKAKPSFKTIKKFNKTLCVLLTDVHKMRDDYYYGFCVKCYKVKEYMEKSCAGDVPNLEGKFNCEDCKDSGLEGIKHVECPGCHEAVSKSSGCDHMTCVCGVHFCYVCQYLGKDANDVYSHLASTHNGYGGDDYDDDDGYDSDY